MAVTIRDVAFRAGVSPMTVSRVINGSPRVREETRFRVHEAITALGYVPNSLARGLTQQRTGTIGLLVPDFVDPFFTLILRGSEEVARRSGYRVILCNTDGDLDLEEDYLEDLISHRVDGLLIAPVSDASRTNIGRITRRGMPHVLIDRSIPGIDSDVVQGDSIGGSRQLVEHLISLGHRSIAHVTESPAVSTARDRLQGYKEALQGASIPFDERLLIEGESATIQGGKAAIGAYLDTNELPSAIFAVNNLVAVGAVLEIRSRGYSVPEDIAIACFDDIELAALLCPFLTVMAQPAETFGTVATQLLLDRIGGRATERPRRVVLPADLIVRESTSPVEHHISPKSELNPRLGN